MSYAGKKVKWSRWRVRVTIRYGDQLSRDVQYEMARAVAGKREEGFTGVLGESTLTFYFPDKGSAVNTDLELRKVGFTGVQLKKEVKWESEDDE